MPIVNLITIFFQIKMYHVKSLKHAVFMKALLKIFLVCIVITLPSIAFNFLIDNDTFNYIFFLFSAYSYMFGISFVAVADQQHNKEYYLPCEVFEKRMNMKDNYKGRRFFAIELILLVLSCILLLVGVFWSDETNIYLLPSTLSFAVVFAYGFTFQFHDTKIIIDILRPDLSRFRKSFAIFLKIVCATLVLVLLIAVLILIFVGGSPKIVDGEFVIVQHGRAVRQIPESLYVFFNILGTLQKLAMPLLFIRINITFLIYLYNRITREE